MKIIEEMLVLYYCGKEKFEVKKCDKIAQLICEQIFFTRK